MKNKIDISSELRFRTARSGGKGGQNVNKVETMVEALFDIEDSQLLNAQEKELILKRLSNRISKSGQLSVRSKTARTQWQNKTKAITKINNLVNKALQIKKKRKRTQPPASANEKRLEKKKKQAEKKKNRQRWS